MTVLEKLRNWLDVQWQDATSEAATWAYARVLRKLTELESAPGSAPESGEVPDDD